MNKATPVHITTFMKKIFFGTLIQWLKPGSWGSPSKFNHTCVILKDTSQGRILKSKIKWSVTGCSLGDIFIVYSQIPCPSQGVLVFCREMWKGFLYMHFTQNKAIFLNKNLTSIDYRNILVNNSELNITCSYLFISLINSCTIVIVDYRNRAMINSSLPFIFWLYYFFKNGLFKY